MQQLILGKKDHKILAALKYKPLYNISHSEKWCKKNIMARVWYLLTYVRIFRFL